MPESHVFRGGALVSPVAFPPAPASGSGLYLDARAGLLWDDGARLGWKGAHNLDHSSICISTLSTISLYPGFGLSRFSGSPTPLLRFIAWLHIFVSDS